MRTAYAPPNGQIVFSEELKATLMESLLLGLDLIVLRDSGNGRAPINSVVMILREIKETF